MAVQKAGKPHPMFHDLGHGQSCLIFARLHNPPPFLSRLFPSKVRRHEFFDRLLRHFLHAKCVQPPVDLANASNQLVCWQKVKPKACESRLAELCSNVVVQRLGAGSVRGGRTARSIALSRLLRLLFLWWRSRLSRERPLPSSRSGV